MNPNEIIQELSNHLKNIKLPEGCDLGDVANEIGIFMGKYISNDAGYDFQDFIFGFKHGVSIAKGTH